VDDGLLVAAILAAGLALVFAFLWWVSGDMR
jgi:hypothetical protein